MRVCFRSLQVLDKDGSGSINEEEFVEGVSLMKASEQSRRIASCQSNVLRALHAAFQRREEHLTRVIGKVDDLRGFLSTSVSEKHDSQLLVPGLSRSCEKDPPIRKEDSRDLPAPQISAESKSGSFSHRFESLVSSSSHNNKQLPLPSKTVVTQGSRLSSSKSTV